MRTSWKAFKRYWKTEQYWVLGVICVLIGLVLWGTPGPVGRALAPWAMFYGGIMLGFYAGFKRGIIDELRREGDRLRRKGYK